MRRYPSQDTREAWARADPKVQDKDGWTRLGDYARDRDLLKSSDAY